MLKLVVGIPAYNGIVAAEQSAMWLELGRAIGQRAINGEPVGVTLVDTIIVDTCGVDRARNYLLGLAMQREADWLLMIDSDTWVIANSWLHGNEGPGSSLLRMILTGLALDAAIIGAPVRSRLHADDDRHLFNVYSNYRDLNVYSCHRDRYKRVEQLDADVVTQVDAIGAACIAINLNKIGDAVFKFTDEMSEDLFFCHAIRGLGKIFVDTRVKTVHRGKPRDLKS